MDDAHLWNAYSWPDTCLRVNFVVSLDGHIGASNGLSGGLSSPEDRRIFHMLRAGCDAILVGAGTARDEGYGPPGVKPEWLPLRDQPQPPTLVMVSRSGNVPDIAGALTITGDELPDLTQRFPRILCEGGPHLFASLLDAGLVDEISLSINGRVGGSGRLIPGDVTAHFAPRHVHAVDDTVFTLWSRR